MAPPQRRALIVFSVAEAACGEVLKGWILGTHQGAISHEHLVYYLDEFTFRFNRRKSKSRGKLFYRLVQQAVTTEATTYHEMVERSKSLRKRLQSVGAT